MRKPLNESHCEMQLFWGLRKLISGDADGGTVVIQYLLNIVMFVPWGWLFPWGRRCHFIKVTISACLMSIGIETMQYIAVLGLCELDDIVANSVGAVIGGYTYHVAGKVFLKKTNDGNKIKS